MRIDIALDLALLEGVVAGHYRVGVFVIDGAAYKVAGILGGGKGREQKQAEMPGEPRPRRESYHTSAWVTRDANWSKVIIS